MDPLGKKELIDFYNLHLKHFGDSPHALRWTPEGQLKRYDILLNIAGDIEKKRILDFGCGKGDFYGYLKSKGLNVIYHGIDINERLIQLAKYKYPEAKFISIDIEEDEHNQKYDIIFICGVFNLRVAGIEETMKNVLKILFKLCEKAMHINLLTYYNPQRSVELFYVKPEEIINYIIKELSLKFSLTHDKEDIFLSIFKT
jgi:2-polyprenyl-3-methyl-5-hydroxy-6-metoxy-1,4-benzoquinol methylase